MMSRKKIRRGFTLLEMAIVLMVVSLVTSAVWVAGQHVWSNYRIYRVNQQIAEVVQNIRDYYGNIIQTWPAAGDITATLEVLLPKTQIFPAEMRRDPTQTPGSATDYIDHAFNNSHTGGSFHVAVVTNVVSTKLDAFRLQIEGLTPAACIQLLRTAPLTSDVIDYVQVGTGGMAAGTSATITKGSATVLPMTLATANTWCTNATEVDFDFALHN